MNQPKILVVDDDKEIVGAIKKRLEMEDYEIITAWSGSHGYPDGTRSPASDHRRYDAEDGRTIRNDEDQGKQEHPDHHSFSQDRRKR